MERVLGSRGHLLWAAAPAARPARHGGSSGPDADEDGVGRFSWVADRPGHRIER